MRHRLILNTDTEGSASGRIITQISQDAPRDAAVAA
jgi:hypothetical protein